jgi:hypothetical protein
MFVNIHTWGTPEECYQKIAHITEIIGAGGFVGVFSYGDMPWEEAERSMRLFAGEVLPELKKLAPEAERVAVTD